MVSFPKHLNNLLTNCIFEEQNLSLKRIQTLEEIRETLFQMQDLKAPGLDGFPALFYKEFWPTVGDVVTKVITSFFIYGC